MSTFCRITVEYPNDTIESRIEQKLEVSKDFEQFKKIIMIMIGFIFGVLIMKIGHVIESGENININHSYHLT